MSGSPTASVADTLAPGWDAADVARLNELADLGLAIARSIVAHVAAHDAANTDYPLAPFKCEAAIISLDFSRLSRSVRLTFALMAKIRSGKLTTDAETRNTFTTRPLVIEPPTPVLDTELDLEPSSDPRKDAPDRPDRPDWEWEGERFVLTSKARTFAHIHRDLGLTHNRKLKAPDQAALDPVTTNPAAPPPDRSDAAPRRSPPGPSSHPPGHLEKRRSSG